MNIVIATGGSGGHIFPAIKVAETLRSQNHNVLFMGVFKNSNKYFELKNFDYKEISACGYQNKTLGNRINFILRFCLSCVQSVGPLLKFKPNVVIGFGSYASVPVVFTAKCLRYPVMIHEQNVIPGKANQFLSKIADGVAVTFEESKHYFKSKNIDITGCPCNKKNLPVNLDDIYQSFGLDAQKKTILVMGGSQGSRRINKDVVAVWDMCSNKESLQVIHICGNNDYTELKKVYSELGIQVALFRFLDRIDEAYCIVDMAITRAGAVTLMELKWYGIPALLIPYPHADGHQLHNAKAFQQNNKSIIYEEKDLSLNILNYKIQLLLAEENSKKRPFHREKPLLEESEMAIIHLLESLA